MDIFFLNELNYIFVAMFNGHLTIVINQMYILYMDAKNDFFFLLARA